MDKNYHLNQIIKILANNLILINFLFLAKRIMNYNNSNLSNYFSVMDDNYKIQEGNDHVYVWYYSILCF